MHPLTRAAVLWSARGMGRPTEAFAASGAEVVAAAWTRALLEHGALSSVDLFVPYTELEACREQLRGLPARVCGGESTVGSLFAESEIPQRLRGHPCDVLHTPLGLDLTRPSFIRARFGDRLFPITCSQHGIGYSYALYAVFLKLLTADVYPCDAIVCLSRDARRALERRLGEIGERYARGWGCPAPSLPRLELIPWGVDTERFAPREPAAARRALDLPLDRPIILCVGRVRLEDKMDWTPLLLAFERVLSAVRHPPLLVLAGAHSEDYGPYLLSQAAQLGVGGHLRVFFEVPPACLPTLYAACDVFVSPSDSPSESFGLTILEAMACGRPVVASDWDGYKDTIVHGETGFRVRTDWADCLGALDRVAPVLAWDQQHLHVGQSVSVDVGEMARDLALLLGSRERREEMGRRARARVEAEYAWPVIIRRWEALWQELAGIARTLEKAPSPRLDHLQSRVFGSFCHYATRIIEDAVPVRMTARGRAWRWEEGPAPHPAARGFVQAPPLETILTTLDQRGGGTAALLVGELLAILARERSLDRDGVLMHLMWLAKYNLVTLGAPEGQVA